MKRKIFSLTLSMLLFGATLFAQGETVSQVPAVNLKTLDGGNFNTADIDNAGDPIIISFWATWCKPCIKELSNIAELYPDWQEETGVKLIAISIDDKRNSNKVAPFVNGKGWEYEVYIDENSDLKRAMNVVNVPHTFLLDGDRQVVFQHTTYTDGDEETLYEHILGLIEASDAHKFEDGDQ
jgi:thiol-disulfide isomerase/thioredoxin